MKNNIRKYRDMCHMTGSEFMQELGLGGKYAKQQLSHWENGRKSLRPGARRKMSEFFQEMLGDRFDPGDLFPQEN